MITEKAAHKSCFFFRTEGRDRTGTSVTSSVFETDASTDSATSAWVHRVKRGCKNTDFFIHCNILEKNFQNCIVPIDKMPNFAARKSEAFDEVKSEAFNRVKSNINIHKNVRKIRFHFCR